MPVKYIELIVAGVVLLQSATLRADDVALTDAYLGGHWSLEGKQSCSSDNAAYAIFRDNGTAEYGKGGRATIVGFWKITDDTVIAHTLKKPTERSEYHPFFQHSYLYEYMALKVSKIEPDTLTLQTGPENQQETYVLSRCT